MDPKRELAIFSITILVQYLGASFAFAWQKIKKRSVPAKKVWQKIVSRKTTPKIGLKTGSKNVPKNSPIVQESNGLVHILPYIDKGQFIDIDW